MCDGSGESEAAPSPSGTANVDVPVTPKEVRRAVREAERVLRARLQQQCRARTLRLRTKYRELRDLLDVQRKRADWLQQQCRELASQISWHEADLNDPTTPWEPTDWLERVITSAPSRFLTREECQRVGHPEWYWSPASHDTPGWDDLERQCPHPDDDWPLPPDDGYRAPVHWTPYPLYSDPNPYGYPCYGDPPPNINEILKREPQPLPPMLLPHPADIEDIVARGESSPPCGLLACPEPDPGSDFDCGPPDPDRGEVTWRRIQSE